MGWFCLIVTFWIFGECMKECLNEIRDELRKINHQPQGEE